jgi:glycosyltransferase involved in cell wall biosynthesis
VKPDRSVLVVYDPSQAGVTALVRGFRFQEPLAGRGWKMEFISYTPPAPGSLRRVGRELAIALRARRCGLVYLLKVPSLSLIRRLAIVRARVVFDLTDSLWRTEVGGTVWGDLDTILAESDAVFTCNTYDTAYGAAHNARTVRLSPYAEVEEFQRVRTTRPPRADGRVRIGWIGSPSTVRAVAHVAGAIDRLAERLPSVELRVVGCRQASDLPALRHARVSLGPADYDRRVMIEEILDMDVGLYPIVIDEDDYRVRGPLKALNYMAGSVPTVCHRAGDCARIVEEGVNGMLAGSSEEWEEKLERLARDAELRRAVGRAGLETVRASYSFEKAVDDLEAAFLSVVSAPPRSWRSPRRPGRTMRARGEGR